MIIKTFLETAGNFDERELLTKFHTGIENTMLEMFPGAYNIDTPGNKISLDIGSEYSHCDVAIMMGSWKDRDRHHLVRQSIVGSSPCFVVVETPLLGRVMFQKNKHFRVGVNGFLNNSGRFYQGDCPADRLIDLGIVWEGWKNQDNGSVYLLLQLPGDASLRNINMYDWARYAVENIRKHSQRKIVIRTHPGHNIKDTDEFYKFVASLLMNNHDISISNGKEKSLAEDLKNAYCTVTYSSGSGIDSITNGIPTIATDPGNFAWDVSSRYISDIENIKKESPGVIKQWLQNLSYSQWTVDEMLSGRAWRHLFPLIESKMLETQASGKKKK